MTRVYDEKYIRSAKRSYALRLCAVILLCMLFCAGYVLSILYPGSKWLTLGIGAAGCIVCCTVGLLLLTPSARKCRLLKEIASGLSASDELLFISCGGMRNFEITVFLFFPERIMTAEAMSGNCFLKANALLHPEKKPLYRHTVV